MLGYAVLDLFGRRYLVGRARESGGFAALVVKLGLSADFSGKTFGFGEGAGMGELFGERIEGDYGRRKFADVRAFAATTTMMLGVSHAASEHLVIETQLARWFAETFAITLRPLREPRWWR